MHTCCAPCTVAPYRSIVATGNYSVSCLWYNNNIHPYQEYKRRFDTFKDWTGRENIDSIIIDDYSPEEFLKNVAERSNERCYYCYYHRMKKTAELAQKYAFDAFTTSLLYSIYQNHDLMKSIGEELAKRYGVEFFYQDFRTLWKEGIEISKKEEMYRQPYCGCIYSEKDRYYKQKN